MSKLVEKSNGPILHWHTYFELVRVLEKKLSVLVDGEETPLYAGDCILLSPGCSHDTLSPDGSTVKTQVVQFLIPSMHSAFHTDSAAESSFRVLMHSQYIGTAKRLIRANHHCSRQVQFLCDEIYAELHKTEEPVYDILAGAVQMLLGFFTGDPTARLLRDCEDSSFDIMKICDFIDQQLLKNISLASAASYMGYSKSYFSHKFKDVTGTGFKEYIDQLKMREARRLLGEGCSVTETASVLGYDSVQNFCRAFKRINHMTPLESIHCRE